MKHYSYYKNGMDLLRESIKAMMPTTEVRVMILPFD